MNKVQSTVVHRLLDKYESSKSFQGKNVHNQNFTVSISEEFPKYNDDAEYEYFCEVNDSLGYLEEKGLISITENKNGTIRQAILNQNELEKCYACVSRKPRKEEQERLLELLEQLEQKPNIESVILNYIDAQKVKLEKNRNVEYFDGNFPKYEDILKMALAVLQNEDEIFIRDLSILLFKDSKRAEQIQSKVQSLIFQYGDFEEKETVLEECGVVSTPTYVMIKGNVTLKLKTQIINLSLLDGDIALSTVSLKELEEVNILGNRVVTIENMTSFHDYNIKDDCVIYLGGFHNKTKRNFLKFLYEQNQTKEYRHFGDMDAGGFYILEHLKRKTGISFQSLYMDEETLRSNINGAKKLTVLDRKRLCKLKDELDKIYQQGKLAEDYRNVIELMLEMGCKLEQEVVKM